MTLPPTLAGRLALPVLGSPLFICSGPELVMAQCRAGIIGSFPALNARPASMLSDWLDRIEDENAAYQRANPDAVVAPYAVNQIVHRSNDRLELDMQVIVDHRVPIVITSLGARPEINEAVHSYGGIVLHDVISDEFAHKAVDKGADGIIAVAAGAGGHAGTQSPFALVQEIRAWFDGPVVLSGAIAHGRSILAALAAGADLAYIGSAFISTAEANADPGYKKMIVDSAARDIVYSNLFTGVHGNYLRPSIIAAGLDPDNLPESDASAMDFGSNGNMKVKAWKDIWGAGQGIGAIHDSLTVAELVATFRAQYNEALDLLEARTLVSR
ncbi:nitronate monooxygenase family protein [Nocardia gipuzkoensis]|uniref:NAD(P)H-dependent flavin oxidoreductase n=1 Tax=Nocardia gipuzkoensis TaxID=2749991 RepID=UPI001E55E511|nr:nitronate monooxygenase family protein [Nocardia gipuzkoensis]UGT67762.1 nitronate monooxygenase family protein [Nocardia gipuzkoensis]